MAIVSCSAAPDCEGRRDFVGGQVEREVEGGHEGAGANGETARHRLEPLCALAQIHRRVLTCAMRDSAFVCLKEVHFMLACIVMI